MWKSVCAVLLAAVSVTNSASIENRLIRDNGADNTFDVMNKLNNDLKTMSHLGLGGEFFLSNLFRPAQHNCNRPGQILQ
jgi:hypothetical protein